MSAQPVDGDDGLDDLLPDELAAPKGAAAPLRRTPAQTKALAKRAEQQTLQAAAKANAVRLAQIVNLHIAGFSLADIGAQIGASEAEIDRMLQQDSSRYVRSQPALRNYVRNFISEKYSGLLDAVWDEATDKTHHAKLEHQDRALRILDRMAKLHGAEMPVQSEVKVDTAPEAVEALVKALSARQGLGYDDSIFDVVDADVVSDIVTEAHERTEVSGNEADQPQEGDPEDGF